MSTDRDVTRIVRSWMEDGVTALPDRVLDGVLDQLPATRQRRAWWPARRYSEMNNNIVRFGIAAAAVAVIAIVGYQLLPGSDRGVGGPAVTPVPTLAPQPSPTDTPQPTPTPEGLLPEGPFVLTSPAGGPSITVTIPAPGWSGELGLLVRNNGGDPPDGAAIIGPFFGDLYVYGDPCQSSTTLPDTPATKVDEAVAALTAQASRDASAPVDITVDGHVGKSIILHVPDDIVDSECDGGKFASWAGGGDPPDTGPSRYHQGPGQIDELWILDVDGQLIVVDAMYGADTSAEHLAELHAILESMTFKQ